MEAIGHAGTCLGILAKDGVLLAAERKNTNKLLDDVFLSEKIYRLHELVCSINSMMCHVYLFIVTWPAVWPVSLLMLMSSPTT